MQKKVAHDFRYDPRVTASTTLWTIYLVTPQNLCQGSAEGINASPTSRSGTPAIQPNRFFWPLCFQEHFRVGASVNVNSCAITDGRVTVCHCCAEVTHAVGIYVI